MVIYILKSSSLINESLFNQGISLVDEKRKEKILSIKVRNEQVRSLGAGLLLQYGYQKGIISISEGLEIINVEIEDLLANASLREPIALVYNKHGKPYLKDNRMYFNISHSKDYVVCAFSHEEVGIDIQYHKARINEKLIHYILTPKELQWLDLQKDYLPQFFTLFSCKEAYIKLTGQGMSQALQELEVKMEEGVILNTVDKGMRANFIEILLPDYSMVVAQFLASSIG